MLIVVMGASLSVHGQSATVQGTLADHGKPVRGGFVRLQQFKDENCVKAFTRQCFREVKTDSNGAYSFDDVKPGWYLVQFMWPMSQPLDTKQPFGCDIQGWTVSYVPFKEMGKNKGTAQAPALELHDGDKKTIAFDYNDAFKVEKNCEHPVEWKKQ
jgi:hypothetical protein